MCDYLGWMGAILPFLPVWCLYLQMASTRGLILELLVPKWTNSSSTFYGLCDRGLENSIMYTMTYFMGFAIFLYVRSFRSHLKFTIKSPTDGFIAAEAIQGLAGIVVLSVWQVIVAELRFNQGLIDTVTPPSMNELLVSMVAIALWADFHFYVTHRLLHTKMLYTRNIFTVVIPCITPQYIKNTCLLTLTPP